MFFFLIFGVKIGLFRTLDIIVVVVLLLCLCNWLREHGICVLWIIRLFFLLLLSRAVRFEYLLEEVDSILLCFLNFLSLG